MSEQQAVFVFKLRRNIALEGDLLLAKMELEAFFGERVQDATDVKAIAHTIPQLNGLRGFGALDSHVRPNGKQVYTAYGPLGLLPVLIRRVSFIQRIYCLTQASENANSLLFECSNIVGPVIGYTLSEDCFIIQAIPHYTIIEISDIIAKHSRDISDVKHNLTATLDALLDKTNNQHAVKLATNALTAQSTTSHLSHGIHYYKAKFFPRMARSMLNICLQRLGGETHKVIDNFVGSGTTLLEASILGIPSVGLDIDPLSVMIANAKLEAAKFDSTVLSKKAARTMYILEKQDVRQLSLFDTLPDEVTGNGITFPTWLMKNRKMNVEIATELSREIGAIQSAIAACDPEVHNLLRILMSDAITHKIRMRFMGTGVGRFSLTFAKASLTCMFLKSIQHYIKVAATYEWLQQNIQLHFADSQAIVADTRNIPNNQEHFNIILTSPPYLPASSGRESYTKARAPSLIALGMRSHEDIDDLIDDTIGSMRGEEIDIEELTLEEQKIVEWLGKDSLRAIKAVPVARYFLDMRQSFTEMLRILSPGGLAVVVSGKTSTFYQFATRNALFVVNSAELLADEAQRAGFEVEALHDIKLFKSNANARPRSLDDYYETLIMLRKPR